MLYNYQKICRRNLLGPLNGENMGLFQKSSAFTLAFLHFRVPIFSPSIFTKAPEFSAWLVEERKINPETISKEQNKKEFAKYVEDYNTGTSLLHAILFLNLWYVPWIATLSHEKYYHIEAYERRMSALRQGEFVPPPDDSYDPQADLKAIRGAHKRKPVEHDSYLNKDQLMELRKVQNERIEVRFIIYQSDNYIISAQAGKMKLLGMEIKQNMGVRMDGTMFDD